MYVLLMSQCGGQQGDWRGGWYDDPGQMLGCGLGDGGNQGKEAKKEELTSGEWTGWEASSRITKDGREVRESEEEGEKGCSGQAEASTSLHGPV